MAVRRGTATPSKVYRGTVPVKKIMRGTVEVWSASIYPVSGTYGPMTVGSPAETVASHTIAENGSFTLSMNGTGAVLLTIRGPWGNSPGNASTATTTQTLTVGDVIDFRAVYGTVSGTWSIVKN